MLFVKEKVSECGMVHRTKNWVMFNLINSLIARPKTFGRCLYKGKEKSWVLAEHFKTILEFSINI